VKSDKVRQMTSERPPEETHSSFSRRRAFILLAGSGVFLFLMGGVAGTVFSRDQLLLLGGRVYFP
jgi:hypothetical protein